jgi:hypothetical protein
MDLSIIIVNWNSVEYLRACLSSVYRESHGVSLEVIVVDNASYDGCEKLLREQFPSVVFIQSHENLGFSRANNLGFTRSSGDLLLFLNPDTEFGESALAKMLARLRSNPSVGAVGARLLNSDGSLQTSCVQAFPTICNQVVDSELLRKAFPKSHLWGTGALLSTDGKPAEVDAISGACFMVKRNVFEKVGLFGEQYFMYVDDLDLSYRIRKAGYSIEYLNDCTVVHHGRKSSEKQESHFSDLRQRESLLKFFRITRGDSYASLYRVALAASAVSRLALVAVSLPFGRFAFQGKSPASVFRKWARILQWAVGLKSWPAASECQVRP